MTNERIPSAPRAWNVIAMLAVGSVLLPACGGAPPPEPPPPVPTAEEPDDGARLADEAARRAAAEAAAREAAAREAEARRAAEEAARRMRVLREMVFFDYDESTLHPEARAKLDAKITILRADPSIRVRVAGHADDRGSTEYNLALGHRRARSIVDYFGVYGIAGSRFEVTSFGEERPLERASTEAAWSRNRRGEFTVLTRVTEPRK